MRRGIFLSSNHIRQCFSSTGTAPYPISKMIVVGENELWCGWQNQVRIFDIKTLTVKDFFVVSTDSKRQVGGKVQYCHNDVTLIAEDLPLVA